MWLTSDIVYDALPPIFESRDAQRFEVGGVFSGLSLRQRRAPERPRRHLPSPDKNLGRLGAAPLRSGGSPLQKRVRLVRVALPCVDLGAKAVGVAIFRVGAKQGFQCRGRSAKIVPRGNRLRTCSPECRRQVAWDVPPGSPSQVSTFGLYPPPAPPRRTGWLRTRAAFCPALASLP